MLTLPGRLKREPKRRIWQVDFYGIYTLSAMYIDHVRDGGLGIVRDTEMRSQLKAV